MDNRGCDGCIVAMIRQLILWFPVLLPAYLLRFKIGPLPTTVLELAWGAVIVLIISKAGWTIWQDGWTKTRVWHGPAALWIVATAVAIFVAPNHLAALGLWRAYVLEPLLFALLLAGSLRDDRDRRTVITALIAGVTLVAVWTLTQYLTGRGIPPPWDTDWVTRRATGPFPFPNAVALFCVPIAALCVGKLVKQHADAAYKSREQIDSRRYNKLLWLGFILGTLATLLAKSVGGFIALLTTSLIALLSNVQYRRRTFVIALLMVIVIGFTPRLHAPIISQLTFNEWSGKVRLITWRETWAMLKDRPLLGAGFGAYPERLAPYHRATAIEIFQYPHNLILNLWSETGLLGLVAFGWICVTWLRSRHLARERHDIPSARRPLPSVICYLLSAPYSLPLIAILIQGLVDVPYFKNDLAFLFWILAVLS